MTTWMNPRQQIALSEASGADVFRQSVAPKTSAERVLAELEAAGVTLALRFDGKLVRFGGEIPDHLKPKVAELRAELTELAARKREERDLKLSQKLSEWRDFAVERWKCDFSRVNGLGDLLRRKLEDAKERYLTGRADLKEVYEWFNRYAKAHKTNYFNRQLDGDAFRVSRRPTSQRKIQEAFEAISWDEDFRGMRRVRTTSVTPQVEAQLDQIERMKVYFGMSADDYILQRIDE